MFAPRAIHLRVFERQRPRRRVLRAPRASATRARSRCAAHGAAAAAFVPRRAAARQSDRCFLRHGATPRRRRPPDESLILTAGPSMSAREVGLRDRRRPHAAGTTATPTTSTAFSESTFADYVGAKHALPTSSCTGALHLSLLALGIGPGDEVIVPDLTWVATANAVAYSGATPVFADVEADSWCLDPAALEAAITPRTRAVMPVHMYGHPARMDRDRRRSPPSTACTSSRTPRRRSAPRSPGQRTGGFGDAAGFSVPGRQAAGQRRGRDAGHRRRPRSTSAPATCGTSATRATSGSARRAASTGCPTCRPPSGWASSSASTS